MGGGAGIRSGQLERLEAALASDLAAEAAHWGGRLLLHAEPWAYAQPGATCAPPETQLSNVPRSVFQIMRPLPFTSGVRCSEIRVQYSMRVAG